MISKNLRMSKNKRVDVEVRLALAVTANLGAKPHPRALGINGRPLNSFLMLTIPQHKGAYHNYIHT